MRLTDISIRALTAPARGQKFHRDDILAGFGVRVSQGGTKSFVLQHGPDRQFVTIGRYPVIGLQDARSEAKRLLAEATLGKRRPKAVRWDKAVEEYLAHCKEKNRPTTYYGYMRQLVSHFDFRSRTIADVTYEDINRRLDKLLHVPAERGHALQTVKVFLNWVKKPPRRYIPYNPLDGFTVPKRPARRRRLSNDELLAIYRTALDGDDAYSRIVVLIVHLGQRRTETAMLRRSWLNEPDRLLTIPSTVTKNKTEHTIPYSDRVARFLAQIPNAGDQYFPSTREHVRYIPCTCFADWTKSKAAFVKRCGFSNWGLHAIRKKFATTLAELKVPPHIIELLLNHRLGTVSNRTGDLISDVADVYNLHRYLPEMREAIDKWERFLSDLLAKSTAPAHAA